RGRRPRWTPGPAGPARPRPSWPRTARAAAPSPAVAGSAAEAAPVAAASGASGSVRPWRAHRGPSLQGGGQPGPGRRDAPGTSRHCFYAADRMGDDRRGLRAAQVLRKESAMARIHVEKVTKSLGGRKILDGVDLNAGPGDIVALIGPSGCGKTTLLRAILGEVRPDAGRIVLDGQDVTSLRVEKRRVSIVYQDYALFPHMTVEEN